MQLHTFLRNFPVDGEAANLVADLLWGSWRNGFWP